MVLRGEDKMRVNNVFSYIPQAYGFKDYQSLNKSFSEVYSKQKVESANPNSEDTVSGKYDVTNCTFDEFTSTIKSLAKEGKLSTHDILLTTANFERSLKQINPNFKYYITSADSGGRRNWVDEFDALAKRELSRGNMLGYQRHMERKAVAAKAMELSCASKNL